MPKTWVTSANNLIMRGVIIVTGSVAVMPSHMLNCYLFDEMMKNENINDFCYLCMKLHLDQSRSASTAQEFSLNVKVHLLIF